MNKAQYTGRPERNYPLSTETLDFIQGEVLPFVGGIKQGMIRIVTTKTSITAGGNTYDEARTFRAAQFGRNLQDAETYPWADFKPLPTNKFLLENSATKKELEALRNLAMPKGGIIMWSGTVADIPLRRLDGQRRAHPRSAGALRGRILCQAGRRIVGKCRPAPGLRQYRQYRGQQGGGAGRRPIAGTQPRFLRQRPPPRDRTAL